MPLCSFPVNKEIYIYDPKAPEGSPESIPHMEFVASIDIIWTGRLDMLYQIGDTITLLDHKTTSVMGATYFDDYDLSTAMIGYCLACDKLSTPFHVREFIINAIALRKITRTGKGVTFERRAFTVTDDMIAEWYRDITITLEQFFGSILDHQYTPKNPKWCLGKYGTCSYHEVCTSCPSLRPSLLNSNIFQDVTWDPLAV